MTMLVHLKLNFIVLCFFTLLLLLPFTQSTDVKYCGQFPFHFNGLLNVFPIFSLSFFFFYTSENNPI